MSPSTIRSPLFSHLALKDALAECLSKALPRGPKAQWLKDPRFKFLSCLIWGGDLDFALSNEPFINKMFECLQWSCWILDDVVKTINCRVRCWLRRTCNVGLAHGSLLIYPVLLRLARCISSVEELAYINFVVQCLSMGCHQAPDTVTGTAMWLFYSFAPMFGACRCNK